MSRVVRIRRNTRLQRLARLAETRLGLPRTYLSAALLAIVFGALLIAGSLPFENSAPERITCSGPRITDGDTFRCGGERVRLTSIDTPEMPGHCRPGRRCVDGDPYAARSYLQTLTRGRVTCDVLDRDHYGRAIARCRSAQNDLSCEMFRAGYAEARYGGRPCIG